MDSLNLKGRTHLNEVGTEIQHNRNEYRVKSISLSAHPQLIDSIGYLLGVLHQISTCKLKCHGGPHVLESLVGRTHSLGSSSLELMKIGYYDESLNLIRSIGEIGNLITLFAYEPDQYSEWISSDKNTRFKKFGPKKIRNKIIKHGLSKISMVDDWYSLLCEKYVHVTPDTLPNCHNIGGIGKVGSQYQQTGVVDTTNQLFNSLLLVTIATSMIFNPPGIKEELTDIHSMLKSVGS